MTMTPRDPKSSTPNFSQSSIELQPVGPATLRDAGRLLSESSRKDVDPVETLPHPSTVVSVVERWNHPKVNIFRTCAVLFAFMIMGANDAAYGVCHPTCYWAPRTLRSCY